MNWASQLGKYGIQAGGSVVGTIPVDWFILAGGGGGGTGQSSHQGGGGGGGGLRSSYDRGPGGQSPSTPAPGCSREAQFMFIQGETYVITVGAGGAKGPGGRNAGLDGGSSSISGAGITTITATGGGGGGQGSGNPTDAPNPHPIDVIMGRLGASSGGNASSDQNAGQGSAPGVLSGIPLQGYAGGIGAVSQGWGGGGGGAGGAGGQASDYTSQAAGGIQWTNNMMYIPPTPDAPAYTWGVGGSTIGPATVAANLGHGGNGGHRMTDAGAERGPPSSVNTDGGSGTVAIRMATPLYTHDGARDPEDFFPGSNAFAFSIGGDTIIRFNATGTYVA
jgi:hypothetical protein